MASWVSFAFLVAAVTVVTECRTIPAEPVSFVMDSNGNPILFFREKRTPVGIYPNRAMMFTGYYRPARRVIRGQGTGVFAQGKAVSGGAYLGDSQPNYLPRGPEPIDDVSSADAEAAPNPSEHHVDEERYQESYPAQEQEQESPVDTSESPASEEQTSSPIAGSKRPSKKQSPKRPKKPVPIEPEEEDESEDEESGEDSDEDSDEPAVPFVPFKSNRRQGNIPNLNNFFPMVFSFPRGSSRSGSSGSPPGMITAIANSYSTSKRGIASAVATAYGGSPQGKKRRTQPAEE